MESLRDKTITDNIRLVRAFVPKYLPPVVIARIGGLDETVTCLMPLYIVAVDAWLDRGQGRKLSTYVYKALFFNWRRVLGKEMYLITFPDKKRDEAVDVAQFLDGSEEAIVAPEYREVGSDGAGCLTRAIAKLPRYEAAAVADLMRTDPRPLRAISEELGITREGVRQARFRGLQRLREDGKLLCELGRK